MDPADDANRDGSSETDPPSIGAPPSFGVVAATSGKHLLPVATAMNEILDDSVPIDVASLPEPFPVEASSPESMDASQSAPTGARPAEAAPAEPSVAGRALMGFALAAVIAMGVGVWVFSSGKSEEKGPATDVTAPKAAANAADAAGEDIDALLAKVNELDSMIASKFADRHALLDRVAAAGRGGDIDGVLHTRLDLLQASEAADPCEAFADALGRVERAEDPGVYSPTLAQLEGVPTGADGADCPGLESRLEALRSKKPAPASPTPEPTPSRVDDSPEEDDSVADGGDPSRRGQASRRGRRRRGRDAKDSPDPDIVDPPSEPTKAPISEPATPLPSGKPPARKDDQRGGVASVLDDGLREMHN